jgi:hypothetical protein
MAMMSPDLPKGSTQSMSKIVFFLPNAVTIRFTAAKSPRSVLRRNN